MANTDSADNDTSRSKRAQHGLLNADGVETKRFDDAAAITYQVLGQDEVFTYTYEPNTEAARMLALFGARTLATNESSQARQAGESEASQQASVVERFDLLVEGKWVERAERVGAKIDCVLLGQVYAEFATASDGRERNPVEIAAKLEEDQKLRRGVYGIPAVKAAYLERAGKPVDVASVLASL